MFRKRRPQPGSWDDAYSAYLVAQEAGDVDGEERALRTLIALDPERDWPYFDLALLAKWRRDWGTAQSLNEQALWRGAEQRESPAAWNLGIAATANGDWATARRAWAAFGISLPGTSGPILGDFGQTPIRLNPEPRHRGERPLRVHGQEWHTEVVWATRLSPATAIVRSLPLPDSGHCFGDVVLHDGEPVGERVVEGRPVPVFNELALLEPSGVPTFGLTVRGAEAADSDALRDLAMTRGGAAENWTTGVQMLCRACSEGTPGEHEHAPEPAPEEQQLAVAVPEEDVGWVLETWLQGRERVQVLEGPERVR